MVVECVLFFLFDILFYVLFFWLLTLHILQMNINDRQFFLLFRQLERFLCFVFGIESVPFSADLLFLCLCFVG